MEDEIGCDDPQFMNMLETCIRVEIGIAKGTLSSKSLFLFLPYAFV